MDFITAMETLSAQVNLGDPMLSLGNFYVCLFLAEGLSESQGDEAHESKIQISSFPLDLLSI